MFTGIIEELGRVESLEQSLSGARLCVAASVVTSDIHNGDSIAVNGVCLTAVDVSTASFADRKSTRLNSSHG